MEKDGASPVPLVFGDGSDDKPRGLFIVQLNDSSIRVGMSFGRKFSFNDVDNAILLLLLSEVVEVSW